jgi:hypothetical protein
MPSHQPLGRHWDEVYVERGATRVSWYQPEPVVSMTLLAGLALESDAPIIDIGGGASHLARVLLAHGFTDVSVLDVSAVALDQQRDTGRCPALPELLHEDVLQWTPSRRYVVWHDRAVFHFLTQATDRARYVDRVRDAVVPGGFVVVGTFAADGPDSCSGLPVCRYTEPELVGEFGPGFEEIASRREVHHTPAGGVQPFTWVVLRKHTDLDSEKGTQGGAS